MAEKKGCVIHAGKVLDCDHDGVLVETSSAPNCAQLEAHPEWYPYTWDKIFLDNGDIRQNGVNPTDSDAYVYDKSGNLNIVKTPCPQKLTCKYNKASGVKLISTVDGIWSKEIDCRTTSSSTEPSTASSAVSMVTVYADYNDATDGRTIRIGNNDDTQYIDFSQSNVNGNNVVCRYDFVKNYGSSVYDGHPLETGNGRFKGCTQLTECNLLCSMIEISQETFSGCTSLKKYTNSNFVKSIGYRAFKDCTSLENIVIGPHVQSIGNQAFIGCSGATNLIFKYGNSDSTYCNGLNQLPDGAFARCTSLSGTSFPSGGTATTYNGILLPNNITSVGTGCFMSCSNIKGLTGNGITYIGNAAFQACNSLSSLTLPNVDSIGDYAFQYCNSLVSINIASGSSENITIKNKAFHSCNSLTSVTIGNSNVKIMFEAQEDNEIFTNSPVSEIYLKHKTDSNYRYADLTHLFSDLATQRNFYVPSSTVSDYRNAYSGYTNWNFSANTN